jgi:4-hydroxybenzoate polyprenyltransferase
MSGPATASEKRRSRARAFLELPHPWAVLIVMLATALLGLLATGGHPDAGRYVLVLIAMFGGQIAIGAVNEYRDRALDAVTNPAKPIPAGSVQPWEALLIAGVALVVMVAAGRALGILPLLLVCLGTGAGLLYDLWLKRTVWSWLPYLIALPLVPIWVWISLARYQPLLLFLYPLGALMALSVHLAQSLPDIEGDRAAGSLGLAARLGRGRALTACGGEAVIAAGSVPPAAAGLGGSITPALAAASVVVIGAAFSILRYRVAPSWVIRHLFRLMTTGAVILAVGWILAIGA